MCVGFGMGGTVIWENPNWTGGDSDGSTDSATKESK